MATKDSAMVTMQKTISQFQEEIYTLKRKLSVQATKITYTPLNNKGNWWSNPYFWMYGVEYHDREACFKEADGQKEKLAPLKRMNGIK